ncbi:hypothetical protein ABW21_db0209378 [Orbilia brochopaga]|nr:hypothetical protein ABW21_db0209378 [Drechslerella brochopaga]
MHVTVVKPPRPVGVRRIAIVGGGPAALSFLLQLKSKLDAMPTTARHRAEVVVLDVSARFGPGQGFARDQSAACRLNLPREFMEPVADTTGIFSAWLRDVNPQCTTEYPPRRFFGLYLEQIGKRLLDETEENPRISVKFLPHCEVNDIKCDVSCTLPLFRVQYSEVGGKSHGGGCLEVDEVLLCTGTFPSDNYQELRGIKNYGYDTESNRRVMASLRGDENVGIIGSRLSAIDLVMELRKRRHSGDIALGSDNGLLPSVSTFYTVEEVSLSETPGLRRKDSTDSGIVADIEDPPISPKCSKGGFQNGDSPNRTISYLVGKPNPTPKYFSISRGQPSMAAAINARRCNGLHHLHPSLVLESPSIEELNRRFFAEINAMILEDRLADISGAPARSFASYEKVVDYLANISPRVWLNQQIGQAECGTITPHHILFFQLYPHIPNLWARLPEEEKRRYREKFHWLFMSFYSPFPLENAWPMHEMLSQGQVTILRECKFTCDADSFVMNGQRAESKETEIRRITHLFNASGLGSDIRNHPLYSKLLDSGLVYSHLFGGVEFETDTARF